MRATFSGSPVFVYVEMSGDDERKWYVLSMEKLQHAAWYLERRPTVNELTTSTRS